MERNKDPVVVQYPLFIESYHKVLGNSVVLYHGKRWLQITWIKLRRTIQALWASHRSFWWPRGTTDFGTCRCRKIPWLPIACHRKDVILLVIPALYHNLHSSFHKTHTIHAPPYKHESIRPCSMPMVVGISRLSLWLKTSSIVYILTENVHHQFVLMTSPNWFG